jgi:hypothetical protein
LAPTIPTTEPDAIAAGNTAKWTISLADYPPADGWALTYYLRGPSKLDVAATPGTVDYAVVIGATSTQALKPGAYRWEAKVAKSGEVFTARSGILTVTPNVATAAAGELLTHAERTLAVIEAKLEGRLEVDMETYQIGDRAVSKIPIAQLHALLGKYRAMVQRERNPGTLGRTTRFVFNRA